MNTRCAVALALGVVAGLDRTVYADDPKDTADTVASTWTGGALRLAEDDKRFVLAMTSMIRGVRVRSDLSAPLDDDTRTAAFVGKSGLAPGFKGSFYVGYESTYDSIALDADTPGKVMLDECNAAGITTCTSDALSKIQKERRREGQPVGEASLYWGAGVDLSFSYDRAEAYQDDVAMDAREFSSSDLQIGGMATVYLPGSMTISLRGGAARTDAVQLTGVRRCRGVNSTDPSITGESCKDAKLLVSDAEPSWAGYVRASIATYPKDSLVGQYISAAELRLDGESLGEETASFDTHVLVFARGLKLASGSVRTGIGITVRTAIDAPDTADYDKGDIYDYSLFGIIGTSF